MIDQTTIFACDVQMVQIPADLPEANQAICSHILLFAIVIAMSFGTTYLTLNATDIFGKQRSVPDRSYRI